MGETKAQGVVLPSPVRGLNFKDNLSLMDPSYAVWMENIDCNGSHTALRYGHSILGTVAVTNNTQGALGVHVYNGGGVGLDKIFSTVYSTSGAASGIYDYSSGGTAAISTTATVSPNFYSDSTMFNKHLYVFVTSTPGVFGKVYDGSSWADIGFTGPSYIYAGTSYRGRFYAIDPTYYGIYYGGIDAITGALTGFPLGSIFKGGSQVYFIATFTATDGVVNQEYMAIGNDIGEVLIYAGGYPLDQSWTLTARFKIGRPLGFNQAFTYQGDALIITNTGLVSLRDLLTRGSASGANLTVSMEIDTYWKKLVDAQPATFGNYPRWYGVFWPSRKKIIISTLGFLEEGLTLTTTKGTFFVFDTLTLAWSVYSSTGVGPFFSGLNIANDNCYASIGLSPNSVSITNAVLFKISDTTTYVDGDYTAPAGAKKTYPFKISSTWNSFGDQIRSKKIGAFETLVYTDLFSNSGSLTLKTATDFGEHTSSACEVSMVVAQAGYKKLSYNVGGEGTFFQYQIIGNSFSSSTYGYKLFSVNAILTVGGVGV